MLLSMLLSLVNIETPSPRNHKEAAQVHKENAKEEMEEAGEHIKEGVNEFGMYAKEKVVQNKDAVYDAYGNVVGGVSHAGGKVKEGIKGAASAVKEKVIDSRDYVAGGFKNAKDSVIGAGKLAKDKAAENMEYLSEGINNLQDGISDTVDSAKQKAAENKDYFAESLGNIKEGLEDAANDFSEGVTRVDFVHNLDEAKENVGDKVGDLKDKIADGKDNAAEYVGNLANEAGSKVQSATDNIKGKVSDKFQDVVDDVKEKYEKLTGAAKDTKTKLNEGADKYRTDFADIKKQIEKAIRNAFSVYEPNNGILGSVYGLYDNAYNWLTTPSKRLTSLLADLNVGFDRAKSSIYTVRESKSSGFEKKVSETTDKLLNIIVGKSDRKPVQVDKVIEEAVKAGIINEDSFDSDSNDDSSNNKAGWFWSSGKNSDKFKEQDFSAKKMVAALKEADKVSVTQAQLWRNLAKELQADNNSMAQLVADIGYPPIPVTAFYTSILTAASLLHFLVSRRITIFGIQFKHYGNPVKADNHSKSSKIVGTSQHVDIESNKQHVDTKETQQHLDVEIIGEEVPSFNEFYSKLGCIPIIFLNLVVLEFMGYNKQFLHVITLSGVFSDLTLRGLTGVKPTRYIEYIAIFYLTLAATCSFASSVLSVPLFS